MGAGEGMFGGVSGSRVLLIGEVSKRRTEAWPSGSEHASHWWAQPDCWWSGERAEARMHCIE